MPANTLMKLNISLQILNFESRFTSIIYVPLSLWLPKFHIIFMKQSTGGIIASVPVPISLNKTATTELRKRMGLRLGELAPSTRNRITQPLFRCFAEHYTATASAHSRTTFLTSSSLRTKCSTSGSVRINFARSCPFSPDKLLPF